MYIVYSMSVHIYINQTFQQGLHWLSFMFLVAYDAFDQKY